MSNSPAYVSASLVGTTTLPFTNKTGSYVIDVTTDCVVNCTSGTFTVTLPTAVGIEGQYFTVKNSGTGVITIDGDGSETIDGAANKILAVQYESITVVSDGVNWVVI
jgi:hypothetical protein